MEHIYTANIKSVLEKYFGENSNEIFDKSQLIQYINEKTRSANRGSKSRSSFANLYAIYVIIEDYLSKKFDKKGDYSKYEGALFNKLFARQRELPFGGKLQNHALNNRMNSEFQKYFLDIDKIQKYPITFVIKSDEKTDDLLKKIRENASKTYSIEAIVDKYMDCIEESINIPILNLRFKETVKHGYLKNILHEIVIQSKVEFNYEDEEDNED